MTVKYGLAPVSYFIIAYLFLFVKRKNIIKIRCPIH